MGMVRSHDLFKFWEIRDNISETVQDRDMVANMKSYAAYRMAPVAMPLNVTFPD